uniref:Ubiquitin carboxyl-terminal hydrolase 48 n=1 Tax=Petromyzon marinus TaxID=7757 RepID=A0AAJ7X7V7_PETMA|nr:ubiquitin carboxyl-terminal hydrolase 48 isoform X1 [Petromyzon marinus]
MGPKARASRGTAGDRGWAWVVSVGPEAVGPAHLHLAYRLALPPCASGGPRRNCKGNPNCLVGLGEQAWLGDLNEEAFHQVDDPDTERRAKNSFVGLKNLGATCYVNTFLQVWFHNHRFRQLLYLYRPDSPSTHAGTTTSCSTTTAATATSITTKDGATTDSETTDRTTITSSASTMPQGATDSSNPAGQEQGGVCEHLQLLFALLQESERRYLDPSPFIRALGLDTAQQQDAQEFSKLLMALLEDALSRQRDSRVRDLVQSEFCGQYAYVTTCGACGHESRRPARFLELDLNIQGHKQLTDCLDEFLKEEKLEGENRYLCGRCQVKQTASRRIQLLGLPRTLNLQLLRFVFDRQTGHKKKLNSYLSFPETLDMRPYLQHGSGEGEYELSAVLIHRGVSAYSGHYIAHIRDARTGEWHKFNDDEIERVEGRHLLLGAEDDLEPSRSVGRRPKCVRGVHSSRNAYSLVYTVRGEPTPTAQDTTLPEWLAEKVRADNRAFEEWCEEMSAMRQQSIAEGRAKHSEVRSLYALLPADNASEFEFVGTAWLRQWLTDSACVRALDNAAFVCTHGALSPHHVGSVKRISRGAANALYHKYGGGPRLTEASLCRDCVVERCRVLQLKSRLSDDYRTVSTLLKSSLPPGEAFWVGKVSLRSWRLLVIGQFEDKEEESKPSNGGGERSSDEAEPEPAESVPAGARTARSSAEEDGGFNDEVLCPHGGLSTREGERRLVSAEVWHKLRGYFPSAPEFRSDAQPCAQCQRLEREGEETGEMQRMIATEQKGALTALFQDKGRPTLQPWPQDTETLYVVSQYFLDEWRKFIRRPTRASPVFSVGNSTLLCPHSGLMFTPDSVSHEDASLLALVWPPEWDVISRSFQVDLAITITRRPCGEGSSEAASAYITQPGVCVECQAARRSQQQRDQQEYTQATVYVRKVVKDFKVMKEAVPELTQSGSEPEEVMEGTDEGVQGEKDPDFSQQANGLKRRRVSPLEGPGSAAAAAAAAEAAAAAAVRRSARHRRVRGEKGLVVSARQTLRELKIQIMHAFSVAPFDQNLSVDGRILSDDSASLGHLGVLPNSVILLQADEPIADYSSIDDITQVCLPEEGFKGTGLLGH